MKASFARSLKTIWYPLLTAGRRGKSGELPEGRVALVCSVVPSRAAYLRAVGEFSSVPAPRRCVALDGARHMARPKSNQSQKKGTRNGRRN